MRHVRHALLGATLAAMLIPGAVSAGPPITFGFPVECSDGSTFEINFGAPKNQGTAIHIVGENSILTSNGYAIWFDGELFVEFKPRGIQAVDAGPNGVVCEGGFEFDDESGHHVITYVITGWITPRG